MNHIEKLKSGLNLCILKSTSIERTSSIAITEKREYLGALIGSDTHLLNIPSEQTALALSVGSTDFPVKEIVTMSENGSSLVSPVVIKILVDYAARTGAPLKYKIVNTNGEALFETKDVRLVFPLYNPSPIPISKIKEKYSPNRAEIKIGADEISVRLKEYAILGLNRNFPLYDSASSYGTAVYTSQGNIYYAGQYSSPDKRLNLHSEMTAILSALMDNERDIIDIGVVSTKYPDSPCNMCGICRQFISEISSKLNISPNLYCFASETSEFKKWSIAEYLPDSWSSKKWQL
ncbi:MAG: hypothetical protein HYS51_01900 [Candidatus Zambryskibacteria bacterium]|nr:hypothetical protein [Candidatus Zambryskibacteria bacterium]